MESSQGLIDLLLSAVDLIEELVSKVDVDNNKVTPVDTSVMAQLLQKVLKRAIFRLFKVRSLMAARRRTKHLPRLRKSLRRRRQ